jgi:hypothetical protein
MRMPAKKSFRTTTPKGTTVPLPKPFTVKARASNLPTGKLGFMMWAKNTMPKVYEHIVTHVNDEAATVSGLGAAADSPFDPNYVEQPSAQVTPAVAAASTAPATPSWVSTIQNITAPLLNVYQQKKIVDLQLQRAASGLAPLDIQGAPQYMSGAGGSGMSNTVLIGGGIVLLGFVAWMFLGKKRRR